MSFILDALKKSENERQRRIGPSLADVQIRRRAQNRPWWAAAVGILLVINLGVLIAVLTRNTSAPAPPAATPAPTTAASPPPAAPAPAASAPVAPASTPTTLPAAAGAPNPSVRSLADEAGSVEPPLQDAPAGSAGYSAPDLSAAAAVPEGPPLVRPIEPGLAATPSIPARENVRSEVLPTNSDLTAAGTSLPEMHLDIHVHSNDPTERFVFINMRKYVEGQSLSEGPTLERITPEGAVLNQRGLRFLLPRQ